MVRMIKSFFSFENEEESTGEYIRQPVITRGKVVPISDRVQQSAINIKSPRSMDDARDAADKLKESRVVVMNLSKLEKDLAKEIVYFLSGTIYALGGDSKKVGSDIFMFTPSGVAITQLDDTQDKRSAQNSLGFDEI